MDISPWVTAQACRRSQGGARGQTLQSPWPHNGSSHSSGVLAETNYTTSSSVGIAEHLLGGQHHVRVGRQSHGAVPLRTPTGQ